MQVGIWCDMHQGENGRVAVMCVCSMVGFSGIIELCFRGVTLNLANKI